MARTCSALTQGLTYSPPLHEPQDNNCSVLFAMKNKMSWPKMRTPKAVH